MFRLLIITLALIAFNEAAISNLQLVVPDDSYGVLTSGKLSATSSRGSNSVSLSNAISEEDGSNSADNEEPEEAAASPAASASVQPAAAPTNAPSAAPAAITRARTAPSLSASSSSGLSRSSLLVSSSASASSSGSTVSASASSPLTRSSATIQHRILPAETIPLPITISTRPGLRTVIAPETITIQQPTIAKVGEVVQQIPTAVSHQRQTVVHNHARVVTPIVAPAVRTITSQIVRAYHTPLLYAPQQPTIQVVNN